MKNTTAARLKPHDTTPRPDWKRNDLVPAFNPGARVSLVGGGGQALARATIDEREAGRFEITRLMPFERDTFQYRIKDMTSGRERVVQEDQITAFLP